MAVWLNHPKYARIRDQLISRLQSENYRFRSLDKVLFLCGGMKSRRRDNLRDYLTKYHSNLSIIYAESVWEEIVRAKSTSNALEVEDYLASLADMVVIIVESPGTLAELGAFSLSNSLRKKLLPILDAPYEFPQDSFIKTGPIRWVDQDSDFRPTIYVALTRILEAASAIDVRISKLPVAMSTNILNLADNRKLLVFFISDLLAVISPVTIRLLHYYLARILRSNISEDEVATLVGVAIAMNLIRPVVVNGDSAPYYLGRRTDGLSNPFHEHQQRVHLPTLRASHLSVLQTIPSANAVIEAIKMQDVHS